jgi:hypothetical protein
MAESKANQPAETSTERWSESSVTSVTPAKLPDLSESVMDLTGPKCAG